MISEGSITYLKLWSIILFLCDTCNGRCNTPRNPTSTKVRQLLVLNFLLVGINSNVNFLEIKMEEMDWFFYLIRLEGLDKIGWQIWISGYKFAIWNCSWPILRIGVLFFKVWEKVTRTRKNIDFKNLFKNQYIFGSYLSLTWPV